MQDKTILSLAAIFSVTVLEVYALSQGINGTYLAGAVGVICALAGYKLRGPIEKLKEKLKPSNPVHAPTP